MKPARRPVPPTADRPAVPPSAAWFDRFAWPLFAIFGIGLAVSLGLCAWAKPFWHDEVYTILGSQLTPATLWTASLDGFDLTPPLNTVVTRYVHAVAGVGPISTRLVPMAGVWVACLIAFVMTKRRANGLMGLTAALLLACTGLFEYGYEARGYGLESGLFAAALYGWSEAARGHRRGLHLGIMAVALAAGLWTHYYAVLAFVPIGLGELSRQLGQRRFDGLPWLLMLGAGASAAPLRALAAAGARQAQTFWTATGTDSVAVTYGVVLGALATVTMAIASAVVIAAVVFSRVVRRERPDSRALPPWEIVAGIGGMAMPALGLALGSLIGVFVPRYVLLSAVGLAIVIATAIGRLTAAGSLPQYAAALAVVVAAGQAGAAAMTPGRFVQWNPCLERQVLTEQLRTQPEIVVTGGVAYLQLWYYAPPELRSKMRYLADPPGALQLTRTDSVDRGYSALARWTTLPVTDAEAYVTQHRDFLVYDAGGFWSLPRLKAKGASFQVIAREPRGNLVRVRLGSIASLPPTN